VKGSEGRKGSEGMEGRKGSEGTNINEKYDTEVHRKKTVDLVVIFVIYTAVLEYENQVIFGGSVFFHGGPRGHIRHLYDCFGI
jgi:hypothetical protein